MNIKCLQNKALQSYIFILYNLYYIKEIRNQNV